MAATQQAAVTIIHKLTVAPAGIIPATSLPLTFFDVVWLQGGAVERIFFYNFPNSTSHFVDQVLPDLTSSLSFTLQHFFPFAGGVRLSPNSTDQYELYFDPKAVTGVPFTVAETNADFDYLAGDGDRDPTVIRQLVPSLQFTDDGVIPVNLLAVQATIFPGRGLSLSVVAHHVVCDGLSSIHFLKAWANGCSNWSSPSPPPPSPPPLFDKSVIQDPKGIYNIYLKDIREYAESHSKKMMAIESPPEVVLATFTLSKQTIEKLKEILVTKKPNIHCSAFVVACAYVWVCLVKSRNYKEEQEVGFGCAADVRSRMKPPVAANYFGNCILLILAEPTTAGDLSGEDGFFKAAEAIGTGIKMFNEDPMRDVEKLIKIAATSMQNRPMSIAGSPKFRVYDVDFGWGSPEKVEVLSIIETGAVSLAESKDKLGGIQVGVVCPRSEMEIFRSHFFAGLD